MTDHEHGPRACFERVYDRARESRALILDWPLGVTLACLESEHGCCRHDWCKCECHGEP